MLVILVWRVLEEDSVKTEKGVVAKLYIYHQKRNMTGMTNAAK